MECPQFLEILASSNDLGVRSSYITTIGRWKLNSKCKCWVHTLNTPSMVLSVKKDLTLTQAGQQSVWGEVEVEILRRHHWSSSLKMAQLGMLDNLVVSMQTPRFNWSLGLNQGLATYNGVISLGLSFPICKMLPTALSLSVGHCEDTTLPILLNTLNGPSPTVSTRIRGSGLSGLVVGSAIRTQESLPLSLGPSALRFPAMTKFTWLLCQS